MSRINPSLNKENIAPDTDSTLADVRAKANALREQLSQDKFEAAAFKASPKKVLAQHDQVLADIRQVPSCSMCKTTCGGTCKVTNFCTITNR